jgi:large conductance mechanosensitive channel
MSLLAEFKKFAMRGNVIDLAVGVVIGTAFGKIVSSLVEDVIMPLIGKVIGGVNFTDLVLSLGTDPSGKPLVVKYGEFLQSVFDFVLIAASIFMALKVLNKLITPSPGAPPPADVRLLTEIRDLLKKP